MAKPRRPRSAEVGPLRLSVVRGPTEGKWYWRARRKGERDTIWTGWATREEAMAAVAALVAGGLPDSRRSAALAAPTTVEELVSAWLADREGQVWHGPWRERPGVHGLLSPLSYQKYQIAARHIIAWVGAMPLSHVTDKTLATYAVNRRTRDTRPAKSDRTVAAEIGVLNFAWIWARKRRWVTGDLPKVVDLDPTKYVNNRTTPTLEQVRAILPLLEGDSRLAIQLITWTGARIVEITGKLDIRDVNLDAGLITLHGKGGKDRTVPIPEVLREEMTRRVAEGRPEDPLLVEESPWVRSRASKSTEIRTNTLRRRITRACQRAGVPAFTPHGLRRLADDLLYEAGVDPGITAKTLGQCPEVALRNYRQVRPNAQHRALLRAGLDAVLREPGDKVVRLPGASDEAHVDLSSFETDLLVAELQRRGWTLIPPLVAMAAEGS